MSTTRIRETLAVDCPVEALRSALDAFLSEKCAFGNVHRRLQVSLDGIPMFAGLALTHDVLVDAYRDRDDQNLNDLTRIAWKPDGGGPFPKFSGTIDTWAQGDSDGSVIEIDGTYAPPFGIAGEAFDAAVGRLIAQRTAATLLADIVAPLHLTSQARRKTGDAAL